MKLPLLPKRPLGADPDPLFRFEWNRLPDGRISLAVSVALTRGNMRWLIPSIAMGFGLYQNFDKLLPHLASVFLLP